MCASVVRLNLVAPHTDWTVQELGEFYRALEALGRVGISVEIDRGMTDEGDPWVVFCRATTGEVLAHIARIGREYVVDHELLETPLRGANFPDLIETFVSRFEGGRSHATARSARLFVHPAASLVALVASLAMLADAAPAAADTGVESIPGPEDAAHRKLSAHDIGSLLSEIFWRSDRAAETCGERRSPTTEFQKICAITVLAAIAVASDALSDELQRPVIEEHAAKPEHAEAAQGQSTDEQQHAEAMAVVDPAALAHAVDAHESAAATCSDHGVVSAPGLQLCQPFAAGDQPAQALASAALANLSAAAAATSFAEARTGTSEITDVLSVAKDAGPAAGHDDATLVATATSQLPLPGPHADQTLSDLDGLLGNSWQSMIERSQPVAETLTKLVESAAAPAAKVSVTPAPTAALPDPLSTTLIPTQPPSSVDAGAGSTPGSLSPSPPPAPVAIHVGGDAEVKAFVALTKSVGIVETHDKLNDIIIFDKDLMAHDLTNAVIETVTTSTGEHIQLVGLASTFEAIHHATAHAAG